LRDFEGHEDKEEEVDSNNGAENNEKDYPPLHFGFGFG
jgi:hypothetical protein